MTGAFDVVRELEAAVADRASVWEFVRRFTAAWQEPIEGSDGCDESELDSAEQGLDLPLPAALREAYALLGRSWHWTTCGHDELLPPELLKLDESGSLLVFRVNVHGPYTLWGVRVADLNRPDPPVWITVYMDDPKPGNETWQPLLPKLSMHIVEVVLQASTLMPRIHLDESCNWEATRRCCALSGRPHPVEGHILQSDPVVYGDSHPGSAALVALVERHYDRLALPDLPPRFPDEGPARWFGAPDIVIGDVDGRLWVATRTARAMDDVHRTLSGGPPSRTSGWQGVATTAVLPYEEPFF